MKGSTYLLLLVALFAFAKVTSSPLEYGEELDPTAPIVDSGYTDDVYDEEQDEDSGRGLFSVIKAAGKLVGSAIIKGGAKIIKSSIVKTGKKLVFKGTKKLVGIAAEELAGQAIGAGINAIAGNGEVQEGEDYEEVEEVDLFEFLASSEHCTCTKQLCKCAAEVPDYEKSELNAEFLNGGSLWKADSEIKISTFYGGEKAIIQKFPVGTPTRKCRRLPEEMGSLKMCISSIGASEEGNTMIQCFNFEFSGHSFMKCMSQKKNGEITF